ncbi:MAG: outer-membrane lipoprotein carrier protein LolA [Helicobacteraceae bacterium]|jgi:outer membrane lipoprotein carrier protein|nr:outer-membrane lipoprotein carrier protein LolA [Helicobacteraceae bacterium]
MARLLIAFCCVFGALNAQTPIDFTTLKQSFVQRVTNDQNQTITFSGNVWLKQPNFVRYDYEKPQQKTIAARGDRILMLEPDLEQATKFKSEIALNIIDLWKKSYAVGEGKREAVIENRKISLEHEGATITKVYYTDDLDNFVEIVLSDPERDKPIDDNFFAPPIPNGWDVISQ